MKNFKAMKSIAVELKLTLTPAIGATQTFLDVPELKGKYIQGIEAFTDGQVTKTPTGNTVFAAAAAKEIVMNFYEMSEIKHKNIPYYTLISSNNGGLIREFDNLKININQSNYYMGGTTATINHALLFQFYYTDKPM